MQLTSTIKWTFSLIRLQNCHYTLLSNTQDQGPRVSTHATQACTQNTLAMWDTTKAHVYQQTLGFTQYQNNLSKDLWLCKSMYTKTIS